MAAADHRGPDPDHYQLLGVARGASREEIAQAWRRRAQIEHPDRRPGRGCPGVQQISGGRDRRLLAGHGQQSRS